MLYVPGPLCGPTLPSDVRLTGVFVLKCSLSRLVLSSVELIFKVRYSRVTVSSYLSANLWRFVSISEAEVMEAIVGSSGTHLKSEWKPSAQQSVPALGNRREPPSNEASEFKKPRDRRTDSRNSIKRVIHCGPEMAKVRHC